MLVDHVSHSHLLILVVTPGRFGFFAGIDKYKNRNNSLPEKKQVTELLQEQGRVRTREMKAK